MNGFDDFETQVQIDELSWVDFYRIEEEKPMIYFDKPTQVRVLDTDGYIMRGEEKEEICNIPKENRLYLGMIGYKDELICGCCGGVGKIEDVLKAAADFGIEEEEAIIPMDWIDISEEILGDE